MFRGHSILIYFAVCATSLAGWNANIWPASNTSPRYVVATNTYAKDMWSWQCHSALVERASLAGVAPPTGTNFYRFEHDNLQAMKDWVEENCVYYLAITGTVEQLEETLATGIAFTNAVHYWTPTGMIAAFNLPTNFFDYTPYRDLNNYAGTQNSPQIFTNVVETGFVYVVCGEQADNCYKYIELGEICGYKCYETTVITNDGQYGWDALRLCITNLKWTYQQSPSNYVTETVYHYSTNHYYEFDEYFLKTESVEESGDCCSTTLPWIASCTNVYGYLLSCTEPELTMSQSNSWNYWPNLKVTNFFHCEYESYNEDVSCYSADSCGPGEWCIYKDTYRWDANQNRLDYGYYSNSFSGHAYVENTQTVGATVYMWHRLNVDIVNTNKTFSEYFYNSATGVTSCSVGDCNGEFICDTFYYYYCEYACANVSISFSGITVTGRIDLAYGVPDHANYWRLDGIESKATNDYRIAFEINYSRWSPMSTVIVDNTSIGATNISCLQWDGYYSEKTMIEEKTEYLLYADGNKAIPQTPYYLFEWEFEYD